jgi:hypothetical protein
MSSTQERLDAYKAAEARILAGGQSLRYAERQLQQAELAEIRKAIAGLEAQLQRETAAAARRGGLRQTTAVFCRR